MNHKLEILGVEIDNLSVQDSMDRIKKYFQTDPLNIIGIITPGMLINAEDSEEYRKMLEKLDLSVIGDKEIMEAAGLENGDRVKEIQENRFVKTLFRFLIEEEKRVILLTETKEEKETLEYYINKKYPLLQVAEIFTFEDAIEDNIVNFINGVSADILLSNLASPYQEEFVFRNRQKLEAKLFIGVGKEIPYSRHLELKPGFLGRMMEKRVLKKKVSRYRSEKGD